MRELALVAFVCLAFGLGSYRGTGALGVFGAVNLALGFLALAGAALLALRQQIQAAREWPIDVPAVLRLALYVGIGLGSWVGSAVVERLLGAALE